MKQLSKEIAMRLYNHEDMAGYVYNQLHALLSPIVDKAHTYDRMIADRDTVDFE